MIQWTIALLRRCGGRRVIFPGVVLLVLSSGAVQASTPDLGIRLWSRGSSVGDGWKIDRVHRHAEFIRYMLSRGGRRTGVEITYVRPGVTSRNRSHVVQPAPGHTPPARLLDAFRRAVTLHEAAFATEPLVRSVSSHSKVSTGRSGWAEMINATLVVQILMLLGLGLLGFRLPFVVQLARRVSLQQWLGLGAWVAVGTGLRLIGGVRVPGFTNCSGHAHGLSMLWEVLVHDPGELDPHGAGFHALHKLTTLILPRTETTVIAVQFLLSVACIPLIYFVSRFFLKRAQWAMWSAATLAVLPTSVFFAATEIRLVPGTFFMLLSLTVVGMGMRDKHPVTLLSGVLLGLTATQFYPILMLFPGVLLLMIVCTPEGRSLFHVRWAQVSTGLFVVGWMVPAIFLGYLVLTRTGTVVGRGFLNVFGELGTLVRPAMELRRDVPYNVFLHTAFTPPVLSVMGLVGLVVGLRNKSSRWPVLAVLVGALMLTLPGFFIGRLNLGRLQHAAQPLYALLVGIGLGGLAQELSNRVRRVQWLGAVVAAVVVLGSVALWPGPIGKRTTLQHERRAFIEALPSLEAGCYVIWGPTEIGTNHSAVPAYLAHGTKPSMRWIALSGTVIPKYLRQPDAGCGYYYRASHCYTEVLGETRKTRLRPGCRKVEAQLKLRPVFTKQIPSVPDDVPNYKGDPISIGFYRILEIRAPPAK